MEKLNVIVKAKRDMMANGLARALDESGLINIIYAEEGDVNKKDWEACQLHNAVVLYSGVNIAYEPDVLDTRPFGTFNYNLKNLDEIFKHIESFNDPQDVQDRLVYRFFQESDKKNISDIISILYLIPRRNYIPKLGEVLSVLNESSSRDCYSFGGVIDIDGKAINISED